MISDSAPTQGSNEGPEAPGLAWHSLDNEELANAERIARMGTWVWDIASGAIKWSDEVFRLFGHEPGAFRPDYASFMEHVHPDDRQTVETALGRSLAGGTVYEVEHRVVRRDGTVRHVRERGEVVLRGGKPARMTGTVHDMTELWVVLQALTESERRLTAAQEIGRIGDWEWWPETGRMLWSPMIFRLQSREGAVPPPAEESFEFYDLPSRDELRAAIARSLQTGEGYDLDLQSTRPDGSVVWHNAVGQVRRDATGQVKSLYGTLQDITPRKEAELQAAATAGFLTSTLDSITDALYTLDAAWRFTFLNQRAETLLKRPKEGLLGREVWAEFPEAAGTIFEEEFRRALQTRETVQFETFYEPLQTWFEVRAFPLTSGLAVYFRDINEEKAANDRIAEQASLLEKAHDAIIVRSLRDEITFWNEGAHRTLGWAPAEVLGRPAAEILTGDRDKAAEAWQTVLAGGEWNGELEARTKEGELRTLACSWTLLRGPEGRPRGVLCIETDITARRTLEQQLLRAQRLESIGTLAGGIAHDLNNLLAPIFMGIDLLRPAVDGDQQLRILDTMSQSAHRGRQLIRQVLSFARGMDTAARCLQPAPLIREVHSIIQTTFPRSIRIDLLVGENLPDIEADPTQIEQVLLNLCVNARDAMPEGGTLTIEVTGALLQPHDPRLPAGREPGHYLLIDVRDTGVGMTPEVCERIFEPFFTTKSFGEGTGLGLPTSLNIVHRHRGFLHAESRAGAGSTFHLGLPAAPTVSHEAAPPADSLAGLRGNGECILVVDDETSILQIIRHSLQSFGYEVLTAQSGQQALALQAEHGNRIALVLTDLMMPAMDGPALIEALRHTGKDLRFVTTSGLHSGETLERCRRLGVTAFLPKPYSTRDLLQVVRQTLDA